MDYRAYRNFDIRVSGDRDTGYQVEVTSSPAGETQRGISLGPVTDTDRVAALLGSAQSGAQTVSTLRQVGVSLKQALFPGQIWTLFRSSVATLDSGEGLRVRLRIDPPEVAALPWEYCYDNESGTFLALDPRTPMVRYLAMADSPRPVAIPGALRMVLVVAAPSDLPAVNALGERRKVETALAKLTGNGQVVISIVEGHGTTTALQSCLRAGADALHYVGHAFVQPETGRGALALEGRDGSPDVQDSEAVAILLRDSAVRLVMLNACDTATGGQTFLGLAQALVQAGVPAVVANQSAIADQSATEFAGTFYAALADGWPVDAAVTEGRKAMWLQNGGRSGDWGIPVLFMRAVDGQLWTRAAEKKAIWHSDTEAIAAGEITAQGNVVIVSGSGQSIHGDIFGGNKIDIRDNFLGTEADTSLVLLKGQVELLRRQLEQQRPTGEDDEEARILALAQIDLSSRAGTQADCRRREDRQSHSRSQETS